MCRGLGIVYGDISTSPLYVFQNIFLEQVPSKNDVLGATSLILWTIVLIVLVKYSLVVLMADDNGEGFPILPMHPSSPFPRKSIRVLITGMK